jgi:hypothetical protein
MDPKYLIFDDDAVIIFSAGVSHDSIARKLSMSLGTVPEIISAGRFTIDPGEGVTCYGNSPSLNICSRPDKDPIYIEQALRIGSFSSGGR